MTEPVYDVVTNTGGQPGEQLRAWGWWWGG